MGRFYLAWRGITVRWSALRRAAPSSRGFRAEVLPSLTNAFYVFSRDYFTRSATPDTSRERACLQTSLWQMATESGRVRLRRDPRGNPTERSIPEFLLERRIPAFSTVVTLASFPRLSGSFSGKNYSVVVENGHLTRHICIYKVHITLNLKIRQNRDPF